MTIDILDNFVALMLAISLAAERLITIIKTICNWLEVKKEAGTWKEKCRRGVILLIAFIASWLTAAFMTENAVFNLFGKIRVSDEHTLPVLLVGFLAIGGSSLWSNLLGYTKAVKDARKEDLANTVNAAGQRVSIAGPN